MSTMVRTTKASTRLRLTTAWCWRYIHIRTLFTCTFRLQFSFIFTFTCVLMSYNELKRLCCLVWRTELITSDSGEEREGMLKLRPIMCQIFSNCHHFEDCCQNLVIVSRISSSLTVFVCVCVFVASSDPEKVPVHQVSLLWRYQNPPTMGQQYSHRQGSVLSCADSQTLAIMLLLMFIIHFLCLQLWLPMFS